MTAASVGRVAGATLRLRRIADGTGRIFETLRHETRAQRIDNDDVTELLELAEALAIALVDAGGSRARETVVTIRTCAALDAHLAATRSMRDAIARVRASMDNLTR